MDEQSDKVHTRAPPPSNEEIQRERCQQNERLRCARSLLGCCKGSSSAGAARAFRHRFSWARGLCPEDTRPGASGAEKE